MSKAHHLIVTTPNVLQYDTFTLNYTHFLANVTKIPEPYSYKQATEHLKWCVGMATELATLEANDTCDVVPFPANHKLADCKWIYKVKYLPTLEVEHYN